MTKRKQGSTTPRRKPPCAESRVIPTRIPVALYNAAKEVAARLGVSFSVLVDESLARIVALHNPNKPRTIVAQMTVSLHEAAKEVAASLKMSPDQFMEYALLQAVELHTPTQGTANDVSEKTTAQKTGV